MEWQQPCDHFFRIILDSTMATKKLILPRLFVETRIDELSETVKLEVPNSRTWTVGLIVSKIRTNKPKAWLDAGFSEFLESLSISHGHFLVFEYRGMSKFNVEVYDKTTCDILYPPSSNGAPMAETESLDDDDTDTEHDQWDYDDDHDHSDDDDYGPQNLGSSLGRRDGSSSSSSSSKQRPQKTASKPGVSESVAGRTNYKGLLVEMTKAAIQTGHQPSTFLSMTPRSMEAVWRAVARPPANPSAMVVLSFTFPYLPVEFSGTYLGNAGMGRNGRWICLEVAGDGEREWQVMIRPQSGGMIFGKNWSSFSMDNHLAEGDVCLFEFISSEMLRVHISRA